VAVGGRARLRKKNLFLVPWKKNRAPLRKTWESIGYADPLRIGRRLRPENVRERGTEAEVAAFFIERSIAPFPFGRSHPV